MPAPEPKSTPKPLPRRSLDPAHHPGFEATLWATADKLRGNPDATEYKHVVLVHISSAELVNDTSAASTGTKMPRTNWQDIARFQVTLPPALLTDDSTENIRPLLDRIISNIHESRALAALRGALLPKLPSGELRLPLR